MGYRMDEYRLFLYNSGRKPMAEVLAKLATLPFDQTAQIEVTPGRTPFDGVASTMSPRGASVSIKHVCEWPEKWQSKLADALNAWAEEILEQDEPVGERALYLMHMQDQDEAVMWGVPTWANCGPLPKEQQRA